MIKIIDRLQKGRDEDGLTLMELVIVVAIIGILTAIAIPTYGAIQSNALDKSLVANGDAMMSEFKTKSIEYGGYEEYAASIGGYHDSSMEVDFISFHDPEYRDQTAHYGSVIVKTARSLAESEPLVCAVTESSKNNVVKMARVSGGPRCNDMYDATRKIN